MNSVGRRGCLECPQSSTDSFGRVVLRMENTFLSLMLDDMMIQMYPTEIAVVVEREKKWRNFFNFSSSSSRIIICYLKMFQDDDISLPYTQHTSNLMNDKFCAQ